MNPIVSLLVAERQLHRRISLRGRLLVSPPDGVGVPYLCLQDVPSRGRPIFHVADQTRDSPVSERHQAAVHRHIQRRRNGDRCTSGSSLALHSGRSDEIRGWRAGNLVHADDDRHAAVSAQGERISARCLKKGNGNDNHSPGLG